MITTFLLLLLGVIVGILGAILGIGGGIVMVPVLTFLFDMPVHNAIAVSLVVITANSMSTSAVYLKTGATNLNLGIALSIASVAGALIGSKTAVHLPQSAVMIILGVFSGLSGAGGGAMIIPGMNLISDIPIKAATATSSFIIGFTAAAGSIVYMQAGYVDVKVVCSIILGIYAGTTISMRYFSKITDKKVSYLLIALLLLVAFQMLYEGVSLLD